MHCRWSSVSEQLERPLFKPVAQPMGLMRNSGFLSCCFSFLREVYRERSLSAVAWLPGDLLTSGTASERTLDSPRICPLSLLLTRRRKTLSLCHFPLAAVPQPSIQESAVNATKGDGPLLCHWRRADDEALWGSFWALRIFICKTGSLN